LPCAPIHPAIGCDVTLWRNNRALRESTVMPGAHHAGDAASAAPDEYSQRLRLRRFVLASLFAGMYLLVLAIFWTQGKVGGDTLIEAGVMAGAILFVFYGVFRSGLNLRFADPSLSGWQLLSAVFTMLFVLYRAPDTRLAFTAFFFIALMFGMLRMSSRRLTALGAISIVSFAITLWLRYANNGDVDALRLDALLCAVMAVTFPWFVYIGERVKRLELGLAEVSVELEDVEDAAARDELTGIPNRRAINRAFAEAKRRTDGSLEPFSICVIDLDHFKRFNDEFGHLSGDEVLRAFTRTVQGAQRAGDVFGRYGGEEFVQILRSTDLAGALAEAERVRARVSELKLPVSRRLGPLTVSVGVAQYQPREAIVQTFARADAALRRAKLAGRNRVEC
jgi:diguanylate cyclase (GGDEF)-like protein